MTSGNRVSQFEVMENETEKGEGKEVTSEVGEQGFCIMCKGILIRKCKRYKKINKNTG